MSEQMFGYIYLTTNLLNKKRYIGKHQSKTLKNGYLGSGTLLRQAIKKHGRENFQKEVLHIAYSREELLLKEIATILEHDAVYDASYYNIANGGDGGCWDVLSDAQKDLIRQKIQSAHVGRPKSLEHRRRLSEARKGVPRNWKKVTREEYSARRRKEVADGIHPPPIANRGNKEFRHSEETKTLIKQKVQAARRRVAEERGAYFSDEVITSIKAKLAERMTPERRERFRQETKRAILMAHEVQQKQADDFAMKHEKIITLMQRQGIGLVVIAAKLTEAGYKSPRGGAWTDQTVRQVLKRIKNFAAAKKIGDKPRDLSSEVLISVPRAPTVVRTGNRPKIIRWERD